MASSRFVRHVKWWFVILPVVSSFVLPFVPDRALFSISDAESQATVDALGAAKAGEATDRANALFRRLFVESGAVQATLKDRGNSDLDAEGSETFAHNWAHQFWMLVYRAMYRAVVMKTWLAGTIVLCVAACVDGTMRRKMRAAAAGYASPLSFHLAMHGVLMVLGAAFSVLMLPVPLVAQCWTAVAVILPLLLWVANSSS
ncbi:DUF4400 domain-containing protein [Paraburkholderia unamae]|uniref:Uncharacterized protein DUF4400 n=1 Tax=Paraburkholderia unamae TaxID=219649 RepID=A0ABX5KU13_9BURK|nr:DUF4400 domain-containing protein [Paraburkholderia unamae]PVX85744.1 uncharacterized protein DUF4400 [Paraburkholderia unamae]